MYEGRIIKELLLKQNKSQTELSKAVTGRPNSSLHYLAKNPTAKTLEKIADFFNVDLNTLRGKRNYTDASYEEISKAMKWFNAYEVASPEVKQAIEVLLHPQNPSLKNQ